MTDLIFALLNRTYTILQAWRAGMLHCARAVSLKGLLDSGSPNLSVNIFNTYSLLTPWCRVLPEQLTGLQLVKKFQIFLILSIFHINFSHRAHI
jgi:hypothetical protein